MSDQGSATVQQPPWAYGPSYWNYDQMMQTIPNMSPYLPAHQMSRQANASPMAMMSPPGTSVFMPGAESNGPYTTT